MAIADDGPARGVRMEQKSMNRAKVYILGFRSWEQLNDAQKDHWTKKPRYPI